MKKEENHGGDQRRSRKLWELLDILIHYRDGRDKPQMENQRCSKLKMEEPCDSDEEEDGAKGSTKTGTIGDGSEQETCEAQEAHMNKIGYGKKAKNLVMKEMVKELETY
ncbi:hypothetical protein YC2023_031771 [Brassica napus]